MMSKLQMPKVSLPKGAGKRIVSVIGDEDRFVPILFLVLLLAAALITVGASGLSSRISIYDIFPVMALPFAVVGVLNFLVCRRWLMVVVAVVVTVALYLIYQPAGHLALFVLICSRGVAEMSAIAQRRLLSWLVGVVERSQTGAHGFSGSVLSFILGIPKNIDARVVRMDESVSRKGMPWGEISDTLLIALVPSLILWTGMFTLLVYHFSIPEAFSTAMTFSVYFAAIALPWIILRTLNVRVGTEGGGFSLYHGLVGTAKRMSVPLIVVFVIVAIMLYTDVETFGYVFVSAVVTTVVVGMSAGMYYLDFEHRVVRWVGSERDSFLPVEKVLSRGRRQTDDVPGTPVRDADSCFPDQKY